MPEKPNQEQIERARACAQDLKQNTILPTAAGIGATTGAIAGSKTGTPQGIVMGAALGGIGGAVGGMINDARRVSSCMKNGPGR